MSFHRAIRLSIVVLSMIAGLVGAGTASAGIVLNTPTGLHAGNTFRFVFVTKSATAATSADIGTYDAFVRADAGAVSYQGVAITNWLAIASTTSVSARDHIDAVTDASFQGLFLAGTSGTKIAGSTTNASGGLWSSTILAPMNRAIDGTLVSASVWTGTSANGNRDPFAALGTSPNPVYGNSSSTTGTWTVSNVDPPGRNNRLYAISPLLTVAVPEIDPGGAAATAALIAGSLAFFDCRFRRRRAPFQAGGKGV